MALSSSQHILLTVSLALCLCFLVPRLIGGGGEMAKKDGRTLPFRGHSLKEGSAKSHMRQAGSEESFTNMNHIKSPMEHELKSEKTGGSRSMAFALMPLYAIGVALFAAYKFTKIKSKENSRSKSLQEDDKKAKETDSQLWELERHLSQTELMLNSILTQLDPLSNCVNTLAAEQKNEIMTQLQSIRQLMKKSGMDKSASGNPANQSCENTLDHLIHSFENQQSEVKENNVENTSLKSPLDTDITAHSHATEEMEQSSLNASVDHCEKEDGAQSEGAINTSSSVSEGLRKRNV